MKLVHFNLHLFFVSILFICQLEWTRCTSGHLFANITQVAPASQNVSTNVPKNTKHPDIIEKRSDHDGSEDVTQSLFKSLIPISPFKKPIKHFFRSWFEPGQDALSDEPKRSTFYFTRPQRKILGSISPTSLFPKKLSAQSSIPHASYISAPNKFQTFSNKIINRNAPPSPYSYTYAGSHIHNYRVPPNPNQYKRQSFALGDPANGRGVTLSFGDSPKASEQSYGVASPISYPTPDSSASNGGNVGSGGGLSLSLGGRGGGSGINLSLGGGGGGGTGSGMSFSLGGGGGGRVGSGMSLNLGGGGGGGSGMSLNLGGGGVSIGNGGGGVYESSGSQSYPSYSSQGYGSNSYGSGGSYGNSYNDAYYPPKPKFSITMPSMGKTVIEANLRPTPLKMKINASPKVKITTGTRDPLEKNHDEEVIMDDIFGPPPPFEKPEKKNASAVNGDSNSLNNTTNINMTDFSKYPFPPYSPYGYSPYYPGYYQYPYNYYNNYYQQYPVQNQNQQYYYNGMQQAYSPSSYKSSQANTAISYQQPAPSYQQPAPSYQQPASTYQQPATTYQQPAPSYQQPAATYLKPATTYQQPATTYQQPAATYQQPATTYQQPAATYQQPAANYQQSATTSYHQSKTAPNVGQTYTSNYPQEVSAHKESFNDLSSSQLPNSQYMDHNSVSYKRSSASRNYQKDMLTLGSNSIATYARPAKPKKFKSVFEMHESKNHYQYQPSPKSPISLASNNYYHYNVDPQSYSSGQVGTGAGYSYYNQTQQMTNPYQSYYQQYYNNPYYYNYYNNYYNYAKQYYDSYYANLTNGQLNQNVTDANTTATDLANQAYYTRKSITGFNQNNLDVHQSKIFGSKVVKYPGGSTKEEKSKIVVDIRPRVTIKMLNRTEQIQQQLELKHKKKEHIFDTKLTVLLETTTNKPPEQHYDSYYDNYYADNVDDFGYAYATTSSSVTTPKPRPSTTTRRRTTTEEPSSEGSDEDSSGNDESFESSEDGETSSTTETSDTTNEPDSQEDEDTSKEPTTSTTTTTEKSTDDEEVIDGNDESSEDSKDNEEINGNEENEDNESEKENKETNDEDENEELKTTNPITSANNVTVSPELVAAMVKALQEALGVTPPSITTPGSISQEQEDDTSNQNDSDSEPDEQAKEQEEDKESEQVEEEEDSATTAKPKANNARTKLIPTVHSALVQNTTHLRLKTPVLSVQSKKASASSLVSHRTTPNRLRKQSTKKSARTSKHSLLDSQLTTTSPFIIVNQKLKNKSSSNVKKIIDGNAVLDSFNVDDLSDDERRDMLTNILSIIQNKTGSHNEIEQTVKLSQSNSKKSGQPSSTKLLPVKTANNVRIVSSLSELTNDQTIDSSSKQPVYVVLLPQNKKKKK